MACRFLSTFEMQVGAVLHVGRTHPGAWYDAGLGAPGIQVFVERQEMLRSARKIGVVKSLVDDMGGHVVVPNPAPRDGRWS